MEHFGCLQVQVILMYSTSVSYFVGRMLFHFLSRVGKDKWEKIKENEREEGKLLRNTIERTNQLSSFSFLLLVLECAFQKFPKGAYISVILIHLLQYNKISLITILYNTTKICIVAACFRFISNENSIPCIQCIGKLKTKY